MHDFNKNAMRNACVAIISGEYLKVADKGKRQGTSLLFDAFKDPTRVANCTLSVQELEAA